jgi:hypothetical protein
MPSSDASSGLPPAAPAPLPPIGASPDAFVVVGSAGGAGGTGTGAGELLVVEVKNVCPFLADFKRPGSFCVGTAADSPLARGPHASILVSHVPQLQLEMLSAGTRAGWLVSSSACLGLNVFRVERDDAYCALLLHFISTFYEQHVLAGCPPPVDFFPDSGGGPLEAELYGSLLARTAALAREARLERHVARPWRTREHGSFFL